MSACGGHAERLPFARSARLYLQAGQTKEQILYLPRDVLAGHFAPCVMG